MAKKILSLLSASCLGIVLGMLPARAQTNAPFTITQRANGDTLITGRVRNADGTTPPWYRFTCSSRSQGPIRSSASDSAMCVIETPSRSLLVYMFGNVAKGLSDGFAQVRRNALFTIVAVNAMSGDYFSVENDAYAP